MRTTTLRTLLLMLVACVALGTSQAKGQSHFEWDAMFDDLYSRHFDGINQGHYLIEVFEHAMGESFHRPPGRAENLSKRGMEIALYDALRGETSKGSPRRPRIWSEQSMDGRPAMTYWDDSGRRRIWWNPNYYYSSYSESASAIYLEQVGHYLNVARCEIAGAPIGQDGRSCPTDHGGSPGARFRDIWLALGPTGSAEAAEEFRAFAHPRSQMVSETYQDGFVDSDGQSSVAPIDIIKNAGRDRYTRRAVRNLLGSDGEASGLFRFLQAEHGLQVPEFVWMGNHSAPDIQFIIESGRLVRVEYRLPANTSADSLLADQLWYTVAQALVDTIHGPLTGTDRCFIEILGTPVYEDHLWLDSVFFDPSEQSKACSHRDTVARALAGSLVHQHEFDHRDDELMDHLFDEVYAGDVADIRRHLGFTSAEPRFCRGGGLYNYTAACTVMTPSAKVHNISSTSAEHVAATVAHEDSCEPEKINHYEDKQCLGLPVDDFCVVYRWDSGASKWLTEARACKEHQRIACQKAIDDGGNRVILDQQDIAVTQGSYQLDFADEACALEFAPGKDSSGRKYAWTAAWLPATPPTSSFATVGSGGASCTSGTKRACESTTTEVSTGTGNQTAGRKRLRKSIQNAIRYGLPPAVNKTDAPRHDVLRVHALNVGNGTCNLLQCLIYEGDSDAPSVVENALVDCGSTHSNAAGGGLDGAGVVAYLRGAHFYSEDAETPLFVASHPDRDHFSHIPGIINQPDLDFVDFVPWRGENLSFVFGGWPEEYIGSYPERSRSTQDAASLNYTNRDRDRTRMRRMLKDDNGGSRTVNGAQIPANGNPAQTLIDATRVNPAVAEEIARFANCSTSKLKLVEVNTPPGADNRSNRRNVRRNRSSAVLQATFKPSRGKRLYAALPGDALSDTETAALTKMPANLANQWHHRLLMASHHGSDNDGSNSMGWAGHISPTRVFYSAGTGHYLHPNADVVEFTYDPILPSSSLHNVIVGDPLLGLHEPYSTEKKHHGTIDSGTLVYEAVMPVDASGTAQKPKYSFHRVGPVN